MKRKTKAAVIIVSLCLLGLIGYQLGSRFIGGEDGREERPATPVVAQRPRRGTIEEALRYPGNLLPERTVAIISKVAGKVENIFVTEGDRIQEDHVLIAIEDDVVRLQKDQAYAAYSAADAQYRKALKGVRESELEIARASFEQAEKDVEIAEANYERSKKLFELGSTSRARYEEMESIYLNARTQLENAGRSLKMMEEGATREEIEMAKANADAMKAQYELAELQFQNSEVETPVSGVVAKVLVEEGNMVGTSTPLMAVVQDNPMYAEIPVPEQYYGQIAAATENMTARVKPVAYPDHDPFPGRVTAVSPVIEAKSRTFTLEVAVENPESLLKPGMYVNVELVLGKSEDTLMVPESSLVFRDDRQVVFVVTEGASYHAEMREVIVGIRQDGRVEIKSGISARDRIIVKGNAFLEDGQKVDLIKEL
jgi:RND family efflux transporter MFP subunit